MLSPFTLLPLDLLSLLPHLCGLLTFPQLFLLQFSGYLPFLSDLIYSHSFKCYLQADASQISLSSQIFFLNSGGGTYLKVYRIVPLALVNSLSQN